MFNLVIFGPPGAGKGTQSEKLLDKYQLTHLSTGDVFRANIKGETELGLLAKSFIDRGELVPDEVTIGMVKDFVEDRVSARGFVFDGFPRTIAQGEALDHFLNERGTPINIVLALEVDEDELVRRLLERGKISGRADDQSEATIRTRFNEYLQKTEPLLEYYEKQGKLNRVHGMGSIDDIFARLVSCIEDASAS
ncbi:MAG: adenylate kinase [Flavobacteriales bacterium]|nr:adenylate kinase [Flavobacteriales bacterium]